ncbi:hypothetical protein CHELA40_12541 [Chelatococcus asaccharovorans]|nr:hypothetical protein CHELA40_12541 [Chelatococcus asaccharovorans]
MLQQFAAPRDLQPKIDIGMMGSKFRQPSRQFGGRDRFQRTDRHRPCRVPSGLLHHGPGFVRQGQDFLGKWLQCCTRGRQFQTQFGAHEKASAQIGFEGLKLITHARLCEVDLLGRASDISSPGNGKERLEQSWMHYVHRRVGLTPPPRSQYMPLAL